MMLTKLRKYFFGTIIFVLVFMGYRYFNDLSNISSLKSFIQSNLKTKSSNITQIDKWIIVTSINEPTDQIQQLATIKDFQLLVVGDKKTNKNWSHKNTIFLSLEKQASLAFKSFSNTPLDSYTRKNLGI